MKKQGKLELTWVGKDERPRLEPRVLVEDPAKSYGDPKSENMLIFGDNLLALKALEQDFVGRIKCIYIDPPFNTQQAFEHYDDGLEHSVWLTMMRDRIELLHSLLSSDGTLCIHIDDNELGYLIVLVDEIFGRRNRAYTVAFKQSSVSGPKSINPGLVTTHSTILIYAKDKAQWAPEKVYVPKARDSRYNNFIINGEKDCSEWSIVSLRQALASAEGCTISDLKKTYPQKELLEARLEEFVLSDPSRVVRTARLAPKDINQSCRALLTESKTNPGRVYKGSRPGKSDVYFLNGEQLVFYSAKAKMIGANWVTGEAASTMWDDLLSNNLHNEGQVTFPNGKKPEALLHRILDMCTSENDWVLDSFGGSGTTGAAAHKMRRRWILVELGGHCDTHILPRMARVVDAKDDSGITEAVAWRGGGGFKYYRLAESLLVRDMALSTKDHPVYVINPRYDETLLIRGICKIAGFKYRNEGRLHGVSSENRFLHITTRLVTQMYLDSLAEDIDKDQSLVVYCTRRIGKLTVPDNIEIRKIPRDLLDKCDFEEDK